MKGFNGVPTLCFVPFPAKEILMSSRGRSIGVAGAVLLWVLGFAAETGWAQLDRYQPVEIPLTSSINYPNPYTAATITASVTPPTGSGEGSYTIPGFWDGGSTWRVRWAPRKAGTYTVNVTCS